MAQGHNSHVLQRRIQFANNVSITVNETFEFVIQKGLATVFATAGFKTEKLVGDVSTEDAVDADWVQVSTDGDVYDFDGTTTTVRILTGPGTYRLVATGSASNVRAGIDYSRE